MIKYLNENYFSHLGVAGVVILITVGVIMYKIVAHGFYLPYYDNRKEWRVDKWYFILIFVIVIGGLTLLDILLTQSY